MVTRMGTTMNGEWLRVGSHMYHPLSQHSLQVMSRQVRMPKEPGEVETLVDVEQNTFV